MAEFTRKPESGNIFEGTSEEAIDVCLRIIDDFENHYNRNTENKLKAEQAKQLISKESRVCFFQKQKADDKNNLSKHKIIIPIENERAIEAIVGLKVDKIDTFTDLYSYRVLKLKEVSFFNEPTKNTIRRNCKFQFEDLNHKAGKKAENFKEF